MRQETPHRNDLFLQLSTNADILPAPASSENQKPTALIEIALNQATPEAEQASPWFKQVFEKMTAAWFDPKSFETPGLYENLGIRTFKKYLPTSGDLIYRLVWKNLGEPSWVTHGNIGSLKNVERFTEVMEGVHLAAFGGFAAIMGAELASGNITWAVGWVALNTLCNVYPIMLQRYNRMRLYKAITAMEARQAQHSEPVKETGIPKISPPPLQDAPAELE